jgi:hypothetical protein
MGQEVTLRVQCRSAATPSSAWPDLCCLRPCALVAAPGQRSSRLERGRQAQAAPASIESVTCWDVPSARFIGSRSISGWGAPFPDTGAVGLGFESRGTSGRRASATWIATGTPGSAGIFLAKTLTVRRAVTNMPGYLASLAGGGNCRLLVTRCKVTGNPMQPRFGPEFGNSPAIR